MKILIVFLGKNGGLTKFTLEFVKGLIENGQEVYCVLSDKICNKELWKSETKIKKISYIYTGDTKTYLLTCLCMLTKNRSKIVSDFKDIDFDLAICTMSYPWCRYIMTVLGSKKRAIICHDPIPHEGTSWIMKQIYHRAAMGYDKVIIMSEKFRNILKNTYRYNDRQIIYMRHGVCVYKQNLDEYVHEDSDKEVHFLFFGRICKYKGIDVLVQAYKMVKEQYKNCSLTIAGSGNLESYKSEINSLEDVEIINQFIPDDEVSVLYRKPNTITVLPYTGATQSGIIPIAMQYGSPIIASDVGGIREQLFGGQIGILVKAGDIYDLSEKMGRFLTDRELFSEQFQQEMKFYPQLRWSIILKETIPKIVETNIGGYTQ